jgi:hypothetical protein
MHNFLRLPLRAKLVLASLSLALLGAGLLLLAR